MVHAVNSGFIGVLLSKIATSVHVAAGVGPGLGGSVPGGLTAVDVKDLAGHEAGLPEIQNRFDNITDFTHAPDWMQAGELRVRLGREDTLTSQQKMLSVPATRC
jgi:hypothetical protein